MKDLSWRLVAFNSLLIATLLTSAFGAHRIPIALAHPLETLPQEIGGWTVFQSETLTPDILKVLRPTSYLSRTYRKAGWEANLFIAYYAQQRAGEAIHSPKACLPGNGWEIWDQDSALIHTNGERVKVNKDSIRKNNQRAVVVYWYQTKDRIIADEYLGKFLLVRDSLVNGNSAGSIVRLVVSDAPGATERALEFAAAVIPKVDFLFTDGRS